MSEEMESAKNLEKNETPGDEITSKSFTFATPSFVSSPEKVIGFGVHSEHVFSKRQGQENTFTFAAPVNISQINNADQNMLIDDYDKPYKPKISRKVYDPPANLFASALRQSEGRDKLMRDFNQLKRQSKSRSSFKEDIRNSITCTNVPKKLLTKTMAKEYFSKFGQILKITLRPRKETITIYYVNKDAANVAFYESGQFMGEKFDVDWTTSEMLPKSPTKKKESSKDAVRNFITADEDDVNAELEAMMGLEYTMHGGAKSQTLMADAKARVKKMTKDSQRYEKPIPKLVKVEKIETESQTQAVVPKANIEELQNIIRQAAHTSEDKYKILEARDRFLRLKQIKPNTLAAAKVTVGTCPDMCPEKERLMRESQRQVALYEQVEGKEYRINHAKAVKQYSRSSADQEEPLAHELRPVASLKMTMSYLLHEIMDMCMVEGTNLAEWFHFLWDRTRGIRKDITQQELCCPESVELVEQCARFHIVCSERLCAEEPSVFDKKINTENLTKCLQTLKYMYHDLRVKGIACENEAEFRGYIILLNLNDGNFMWDLQKLPADIQKSPEVRFAIEVHSSIESHNFVKFFKLVKRTTYLNACILLRYFNQVRVKALSVMVKAYCRITSTPFPLYELLDILGFEDENEAVYFCEQVGLVISNDEMHIMLNRQNFSHPISSVEQGRAVNVVESKRTRQGLSVGQCIAGGKMPEKTYKNHVPHDSFDSNGHLRMNAINVEDQTKQYKNKLGLGKNDPYKFIEEDTFKPSQKLKPQSKMEDQTDSTARKSGQTFLAEPSMKPAGFGDVFNRSSKTAPLFPSVFSQTPFHKEQSLFAKPSTVFHKSDTNTNLPFGTKVSQSDSKSSKHYSAAGDKSDSRFPPQSQNPGAITTLNKHAVQKTIGDNSSARQQGTGIPKIKDSSPFAMTTNKTIFSGFTQGNIFAKPASGASIFGNKGVPNVKADTKSDLEQKEKERVEAESKKKKLEEVKRQLEAEKLKLQELERERRLKMIEQEAKQIIEELEDEVTKEICISVVKEENDKIRMYNVLSKNITDSLLNQVLLQFCDELLKEEIHVQEQLNKISERMKLKLVKKYYKSWRQNVTKKRRQREALDDTPVWLQDRSVSECARLLYRPQQDLVIQNMRRKRFKSESTSSTQDNLAPVEVIIYAGIKENLKSSDNEMIPNIFWKLVISWPDLENRILLWQHKKIMNNYLNPENYTEEPIIKTYKPNPYETLNICIRHFEGIINDRHLVGTDALLFLAASSENLNTVKRRLSKTILSRSKLMPIPIAIVFLGEDDLVAENVELELDLEILLESGYVSEYTVVFEKDISKSQILRLIQSSALWLTTNKSPLVPLEMDYLNQVLSTCLTQELWLRIQGHSNFNKHLASGLDDPSLIINLHNEAVTHLTDIFLDQESLQYTSFPREFKTFLSNEINLPCSYEYFDDEWKKEENRSTLEQIMNSFLLPDWKYQWPIGNISELHDAIRNYSFRALPDSNCDELTCEVISTLFLMSDDSQGPSFIDLLLQIVRRKIQLLDKSLRAVYNKNHVKHFRTLPWWFKSSILLDYISQKESDLQNESKEQFSVGEPFEKRQRLQEDIREDLDVDSFYKPNDSLAEFCKETQERIMSVHERCKNLEIDMEKQKSKNKALNELLEKALMDEDVNLSDLRY